MIGATLLLLALAAAAAGCGGGSAEVTSPGESATQSAASAEESASVTPAQPHREGTIARGDLLPVLEGGLGRFLGGVGTEPDLDQGRFVGWRIVRLYPNDPRFEGIALQIGDTVTRVNGQGVERPEQAFQVWNGLRVSSELVVEFTRAGERHEMRYEIVD
jgi:hypothetical protein